jgi:hypothetical protein
MRRLNIWICDLPAPPKRRRRDQLVSAAACRALAFGFLFSSEFLPFVK